MTRSPIAQLVFSVLIFTAIIMASVGEIYGAGAAPLREEPAGEGATVAREAARETVVGERGVSQEMVLQVPPGSRSVALTIQGSDYAVLGLASLVTSDGIEHVGLPFEGQEAERLTGEMDRRYFEEQISIMPGRLFQSMRMGSFTLNFPNKPGLVLPEGELRLRVASTVPGDRITVHAAFPEDDGADTLLLNIVDVSRRFYGKSLPIMDTVRRIYAPAGIKVRVNGLYRLKDLTYSRILDGYEPQEPPYSTATALARQGGGYIGKTKALNLYVVDELPTGVLGLSLGTPGTWIPSHYFYGVVVRFRPEWQELARTVAHEIGHYLGLPHPESRGASGMIYPDPFEDTQAPAVNLMGKGYEITPSQELVIRKHPLLVRE